MTSTRALSTLVNGGHRPVAAGFVQWSGVSPALLGWVQGEHPLEIPGQGYELPLTPNRVEPAQQKLAEPQHRFDDAEDRFRGLLAHGVELFAVGRLQAMDHGLDRRRMVRRRWRRGEALVPGGMMRLPT